MLWLINLALVGVGLYCALRARQNIIIVANLVAATINMLAVIAHFTG